MPAMIRRGPVTSRSTNVAMATANSTDVSRAAAKKLGFQRAGLTEVTLEVVE